MMNFHITCKIDISYRVLVLNFIFTIFKNMFNNDFKKYF